MSKNKKLCLVTNGKIEITGLKNRKINKIIDFCIDKFDCDVIDNRIYRVAGEPTCEFTLLTTRCGEHELESVFETECGKHYNQKFITGATYCPNCGGKIV